jgi:hypothetical protein
MSDEVYEGAIGIDLGAHVRKAFARTQIANAHRQAPPTRVSPTTRAPMSKSVRLRTRATARPRGPLPNIRTVANEQGSFTTPSFVSFTSEERLIGEAAKNQAAMNPENTVFDVKYDHADLNAQPVRY